MRTRCIRNWAICVTHCNYLLADNFCRSSASSQERAIGLARCPAGKAPGWRLRRCRWEQGAERDRISYLLLTGLPLWVPGENRPSRFQPRSGRLENPGPCAVSNQCKLKQLILGKSSVSQIARNEGCWRPPSSWLTSKRSICGSEIGCKLFVQSRRIASQMSCQSGKF